MKMQKVTDSFELPKDIVLGLPIVTAYGYNETMKITILCVGKVKEKFRIWGAVF